MGPSEANDYRRIRLFALREDPEAFGTAHDDEAAQPLAVFEERLRSQLIFGAYERGKIVGIVGLTRELGPKVRHKGTLWGFFVDPAVRWQGFGRELLEEVLHYADDVVEQIKLTVVTKNLSAISLYESLGFQSYGIEKRALKVASGYDDELLMVRYCKAGA